MTWALAFGVWVDKDMLGIPMIQELSTSEVHLETSDFSHK